MKKILAIGFAFLLVGCMADEQTYSNSNEEVSSLLSVINANSKVEYTESSDVPTKTHDTQETSSKNVAEQLQELTVTLYSIVEAQFPPDTMIDPYFQYRYSVSSLEQVAVFWQPAIDGGTDILIYEMETNEYYMCFFPYNKVVDIVNGGENGLLRVFSDGTHFGGDHVIYTGNNSVLMDYRTGEVVLPGEGMNDLYGVTGFGARYDFGECFVSDDKAYFNFSCIELIWSAQPMPISGPEYAPAIYTKNFFEEGRNLYVFAFEAMDGDLPADFVRELEALEGIAAVLAERMDSKLFEGFILTVETEEDYILRCSSDFCDDAYRFIITVREVE